MNMEALMWADQSEQDNRMVLEASDLGWAPGQWPLRFSIDGVEGKFELDRVIRDLEGDVQSYEYRGLGGASGYSVVVLND